MAASTPDVIHVELGGGLDLLFRGRKSMEIALADLGASPSMAILIQHMQRTLLAERPELFVAGDTVRPGILVLINDSDWELEGTLAYTLQRGDVVAFISTLHGG